MMLYLNKHMYKSYKTYNYLNGNIFELKNSGNKNMGEKPTHPRPRCCKANNLGQCTQIHIHL